MSNRVSVWMTMLFLVAPLCLASSAQATSSFAGSFPGETVGPHVRSAILLDLGRSGDELTVSHLGGIISRLGIPDAFGDNPGALEDLFSEIDAHRMRVAEFRRLLGADVFDRIYDRWGSRLVDIRSHIERRGALDRSAVPEPSSAVLLGLGLIAVASIARGRRLS
jgi:hypothetical protein